MKHLIPLFLALSLITFSGDADAQDIAVKADKIYPVASAPIENGVIVIRDGKIQRVGKASSVRIPSGIKVVEAAVVTPGLIDDKIHVLHRDCPQQHLITQYKCSHIAETLAVGHLDGTHIGDIIASPIRVSHFKPVALRVPGV